jgi:hypothetical protein
VAQCAPGVGDAGEIVRGGRWGQRGHTSIIHGGGECMERKGRGKMGLRKVIA